MITVISYLLLENFYHGGYSGWLFVIPALTDLAILDKL